MADPRTGCNVLADGLTAADVWQLLHNNAAEWEHVPKNSNFFKIREMLDQADLDAMHSLSMFPAKNWKSMCSGIGWTAYGAVALSWCEDALLSDVWDGFEKSGFPLQPTPVFERLIRFMKPDILPRSNSLLEIVTLGDNQSVPICAMISALEEPLQMDMSYERLKSASQQVAAFLKRALEKKATKSEEDDQLIAHWASRFSTGDMSKS